MLKNHAPTETAEINEQELFNSNLSGNLQRVPERGMKIVMGDTNAKVNCSNADF